MTRSEGQIEPDQLLFGRSWEDPEADRRALRIQAGDSVFAITSGGCNALGFLLDDPGRVLAVDINGCQSHLLELKVAAMRALEHAAFAAFVGARPASDRLETYRTVRPHLTSAAARFWDEHPRLVGAGIINAGRYERFVGLFRKLLTAIQGRRRIEGLFEHDTRDARARYFEEHWDTRRFRAMLSLFFNKRMLARRGLSADYFQFDDSNASFAESFYRRSRHVMCELPTRENYFLASYVLGRYHSEHSVPDYLRAEKYQVIRSRLERLEIHTADAKLFLERQPSRSIARFALSNICEMMDAADTTRTFEAVLHAAAPGATACFRNLMIPRTIPDHLTGSIVRDPDLSAELLRADRSFVYGRVDALQVRT